LDFGDFPDLDVTRSKKVGLNAKKLDRKAVHLVRVDSP
jgi:hypothetical protein